ncbi:MAG: polysaccharide deacetylase family protein, partial [Akkermansiaceae bacterium]|nr:polysaccharide deacetylase family protein [Akkermansiaceae bacterium]
PAEARTLLQFTALDRRGRLVRFDAAFIADWGGAIFDPHWRFQPHAKGTRSYFDPYRFLGAIWPEGIFPAPDVTTRDGLRLFWAQVAGDAFTTLSTTKRNATCAELIRDRILKRYPLPITISVIEADIRATRNTQNPEDAARYRAIAREIFRMPHVEAASHSFSHPFGWSTLDGNKQVDHDPGPLPLKASDRFDTPDLRREIEGSVSYIERELLPPGKEVRSMLWTGNCRPTAGALRVCRELGIEAMNGGFTIYSPRHPWHAAIAPRVTWRDGELQVYAANGNEFAYTEDWSGPTFGGFDQVIKSFEMLDSPRRLKPVNINGHFCSAVSPGSLTALERVYGWAMEQPLHAVTASEASAITRDAVMTRIFRTGPKRWLVSNQGLLTTFRVPKSLGYPDLDASTNVTGFNDHGSERFIHTNGQPVAELVLSPEPPRHLFLRSSTAAVRISSLGRDHCSFKVTGYRPAALSFGGVPPGSKWTLTCSEFSKPQVHEPLQAGVRGELTFTLPCASEAYLAPATAAR